MHPGSIFSQPLQIPLSFSFVSGRCFTGVPVASDLPEPTGYDPGDKEEIRKYFLTIQAITNIISRPGLSELQ